MPPSRKSAPSQERRAEGSRLTNTAGSPTEVSLDGVEVNDIGQVVVVIRASAVDSGDGRPKRKPRPDFSSDERGELSRLARDHDSEDVRRAAGAVLKYARGATYAECVADTDYGIGWIRGLLKAYRYGRVSALVARRYRRSPNAEGLGDASKVQE